MISTERRTNRAKKLALLLLLFAAMQATGQEIVTLDMDQAVKTAIADNKNIAIARIDEKVALENFRQTNAVFLPELNVSYTAFSTNNPLNAFGFKLQQKIIAPADFNPATLNEPDITSDMMTRFSARQPILNVDMVYQRRGAARQVEMYKYKTERNVEYVSWQVQQVYLQLQLAWNASIVAGEALETMQATLKQTSDRYQQGLLQRSDLLNVQVQMKSVETQLQEAKSNIANASDYLGLLMNKEQGKIYKPKTVLLDSTIDEAIALPMNRADFRAMEKAVESYTCMVRSSRFSYLPRINAFGDYQLHDNRVFGFAADGYLAGVQLSWDIFKGFQTFHKTKSLVLERAKLVEQLTDKREQEQTALNKAVRQFTEAAYKIRQQQDAVAQATEALKIVQNRYEQGLVNTTDLLQSQTQLAQQKLMYAQAVYERNSSIIYINFLTTHS
ncbi:MAG: TolC family protein [Bacteroidetes bacterium]|nr:TolC family protein [Bacteroidota bacterium]